MKRAVSLLFRLPDWYLLVVIFFSGYQPPWHIASPHVLAMGVVLLHLMFQNRVAGLIIGCLFLLGTQLLLFSAVSEFNQYPHADAHSVKMLATELALVFVNTIMATCMVVKHSWSSNSATAS